MARTRRSKTEKPQQAPVEVEKEEVAEIPKEVVEKAKPADEATDATDTEKPEKPGEAMGRGEKKEEESAAPVPAAAAATASVPDRMARFRALQERAKASSEQNMKAVATEAHKLSVDSTGLAALHRKRTIAVHNLMKAEVEEAGGDFERKRAWDWTAEESERWDKRMRKKEAHRDNNAFQDYRQEAHKVYKRQIKHNLAAPDVEQYMRDKLAAVERAAAAGTLEIVETADGELLAVDKDGTFLSSSSAAADLTSFADNRPSREAIERLANDQRKAEEAGIRKKKERMAKNGEDADVTYINEKNKHFNQKLARFYNKYTAEIRDSFERGTMI